MIADERLRHLSSPDYAKSEPGQLAAELLTSRARVQALEAALREIADFAEQFIADDEDGDERMYKVYQIADNAIPFTPETEPKHE